MNDFDFSNLKALIIDDSPVVITSLRIMLLNMGFEDENIIHNKDPRSAIYQAKNNLFDVFICDYNFSSKINGKQVFEELQHYKRIVSNSVFIIITGESTSEIVRSIVELEPDDYMLKPYNLKTFELRIKKSLFRKEILTKLYEYNSNDDFESGIVECNRLTPLYPKYYYHIQQFLGRFYRRVQRLEDAKILYENVLAETDYDWANIGLANVLVEQNRNKEAEILLGTMLVKSNDNTSLLMEIGSVNIYNNDIPSAIKHLTIASDLVPGNSIRELVIANLCHSVKDYFNSSLRYRNYFFSNRDTFLDIPSSKLNYIRSMVFRLELIPDADDKQKIKFKNESLKLLASLYKTTSDKSIISEIELIGAHLAVDDKRLANAITLLSKVCRDEIITCFYGRFHLCILLEKLNLNDKLLLNLLSCKKELGINKDENELIFQSKLIMLQGLVNEQNLKSDSLSYLLVKIDGFKIKNNHQKMLECYLEINNLSPYLYEVCFEIVYLLTKVWPSNWSYKEVKNIIVECNNTIEELMPLSEKNKKNYFNIYDAAVRRG